MLYRHPDTNFDISIGVEKKQAADPGTQTGGLTRRGQDEVLKFCRLIGVAVAFEEVHSSEEIFNSTDFQRNFSTMQHIPYDSLVARLKMFLEARADFYYFDVDLIMQPGWDSIFTIEPLNSSTAIMAARNTDRISLDERSDPKHSQHWVMSESTNQDHYFNGGVLKFIYRAWDESRINDKLISLLKKIERGDLTSQMADQDVLNHVTRKNIELLDLTFNVLVYPWANGPVNNFYALESEYHPKILHYVGGVKPHAIGQSEKDEMIKIAEFNCDKGFLDHAQNYFYIAFFIQNQRKLFEMNTK
jgi:lipopolysaccharide biosynthesis glycosyltransferase